MNAHFSSSDCAQAAGNILDAFTSGNLALLDSELRRMRPTPRGLPSDAAERWELLDAIAGELRRGIDRIRRQSAKGWEGAEAYLPLLAHLAGRKSVASI